jgi:plasmid rolling circle replication initiator protein Rep
VESDSIDRDTFASNCLIILQGLDNNNFNNWKSSNLWKKYWKYKYESLYEIIMDSSVKVECTPTKKVKLN